MSFAKRHNPNPVRFTHETPEDLNYINLELLWENSEDDDRVHTLRRLYISNSSQYGESPVAVTDTHLVNLPKFMTKKVKEIMADPSSVREINDGLVGFKIEPYTNEHGIHYRPNWVDIKPTK